MRFTMELRFTVKCIFYVTPMAVNISFAKVMTRLQEKFLRRRVFFIGTICLFQGLVYSNYVSVKPATV